MTAPHPNEPDHAPHEPAHETPPGEPNGTPDLQDRRDQGSGRTSGPRAPDRSRLRPRTHRRDRGQQPGEDRDPRKPDTPAERRTAPPAPPGPNGGRPGKTARTGRPGETRPSGPPGHPQQPEPRRRSEPHGRTGPPRQTGPRGRTLTAPRGRAGWIAVAAWAVGIAAVFAVGWWLRREGIATEDRLPPLHAELRAPTWRILPAACAAALAVAALPPLAARLPWRLLPATGWACSAAWAVALAATDGLGALARPFDAPTEYAAGLPAVRPDPAEWLRTFTERLGGYPTHVRGHPPLPTLVVWALEAAGFGGTGWAAAFVIAAGTSSVAAITITLRRLAGEDTARRALPYLVLAPAALWIATTMDAFFLGVAAWGTALLALTTRPRPNPSFSVSGRLPGVAVGGAAVGGGVLLGALPYLNYGMLPFGAVPLVVLLMARPGWRTLALLACGLAVVPVAFTLAGFWWPDGVRATLDTYLVSRGSAQRSYAYFLFGDLAVLGLLTGPAVAHALPGLLRALRRGVRTPSAIPAGTLLAAAALLGTLVLDASGVTRGEVERIWIPYAMWIVVAAAPHRPPARGWLAAQALTALAVQALVLSEW